MFRVLFDLFSFSDFFIFTPTLWNKSYLAIFFCLFVCLMHFFPQRFPLNALNELDGEILMQSYNWGQWDGRDEKKKSLLASQFSPTFSCTSAGERISFDIKEDQLIHTLLWYRAQTALLLRWRNPTTSRVSFLEWRRCFDRVRCTNCETFDGICLRKLVRLVCHC